MDAAVALVTNDDEDGRMEERAGWSMMVVVVVYSGCGC